MDTLKRVIRKNKYLVINERSKASIFTSLRSMSCYTNINYSTLSKKLKNKLDCICTSSKTKEPFYIKKLTIT